MGQPLKCLRQHGLQKCPVENTLITDHHTRQGARRSLPHGRFWGLQLGKDSLPYTLISPPYTFFLLNGDMELYRNKHLFV